MKLPERKEVKGVIHQLLRGEMSRSEVSEWALQWVLEDDVTINDDIVWQVLKQLGAADLISTDRPYLYVKTDFEDWLLELES